MDIQGQAAEAEAMSLARVTELANQEALGPSEERLNQPGSHPFLTFQKSVGNRIASAVVHSKLSVGGWPLQRRPALAVSGPGDPLEQEADRIADAVTGGRTWATHPARVSRAPAAVNCKCDACGAKCSACAAKEEKERNSGNTRLQRERNGSSADAASMAAPAVVQDVVRTPGLPLEAAVRADMEARFGSSFERVRVHTDPVAISSARAVSARAYTVGSHIVFDDGRYAPATSAGRHLLAHELAHVLQQTGVSQTGAPVKATAAAPAVSRQPNPPAAPPASPSPPLVSRVTPEIQQKLVNELLNARKAAPPAESNAQEARRRFAVSS